MRRAALVVLAACSPNYAVPDAQHHVDAPAGMHDAPVPIADALLDVPTGMPDAGIGPPDVPLSTDMGLYPDAPTASLFAWQSLQERFHRSDSTTCTGQVTVAVGDRAVCFVGVDDEVHCAGSIYTHDFGSHFTPIGQTGVDQIWLGMTVNSPTGNAICVHKRAGSVWCMGDGNSLGQFGNGTTSPSATFVQFGSATNLTRMGGDWNTRCAIDTAGKIFCSGYLASSSTPVQQPGTGHHSFAIANGGGSLAVDDPGVLRGANNSPCQVHADGLECLAPMVPMLSGTPGQVVDGGVTQTIGGPALGDPFACWLDPTGVARCTRSGTTTAVFTGAAPLLGLATNFYTDARCAVANDGALWCLGSNTHGELGTGNASPVTQDTMVAAPGSVKIDCH